MRYIILALMLCAGCAEIGMYDKTDCLGHHTQRSTPDGYPCDCCLRGE